MKKFIYFDLAESPTRDEWGHIAIFRERAHEFISSLRRLKIGTIVGSFRRNENETYSGALSIPPDDDMKALYVEFRHIYAQGERHNFRAIANIIARRSRNIIVRKFMKHLVAKSRSSLVEDGFFHVEGRKLSGEKLIDLWFNAKIFHSDKAKRKELNRLTKMLSDEGIRGLFFMAMYDAGLAAKNLYYITENLTETNLMIPVPTSFIDDLNRINSV